MALSFFLSMVLAGNSFAMDVNGVPYGIGEAAFFVHDDDDLHELVKENDIKAVFHKLEELKFTLFNINYPGDNGERVLHVAVRHGDKNMLELLVTMDANPSIGDGNGILPYDLAVQLGKHENAKYLHSLQGNDTLLID